MFLWFVFFKRRYLGTGTRKSNYRLNEIRKAIRFFRRFICCYHKMSQKTSCSLNRAWTSRQSSELVHKLFLCSIELCRKYTNCYEQNSKTRIHQISASHTHAHKHGYISQTTDDAVDGVIQDWSSGHKWTKTNNRKQLTSSSVQNNGFTSISMTASTGRPGFTCSSLFSL